MVVNTSVFFFLTFEFNSFNLKLLFMSDEHDVVKPIKRISSQKILEKLELIEKKIEEVLNTN